MCENAGKDSTTARREGVWYLDDGQDLVDVSGHVVPHVISQLTAWNLCTDRMSIARDDEQTHMRDRWRTAWLHPNLQGTLVSGQWSRTCSAMSLLFTWRSSQPLGHGSVTLRHVLMCSCREVTRTL
jgi:hypothetical protein